MKTILIHSGGLDSTVLLYHLLKRGDAVSAMTIDYGQRHRKEIDYAKKLCAELHVTHEIADLGSLQKFIGGSSLTDDSIPVPDGHYAAESMKITVVPNRNMLLLALATSWAVSLKADRVAYAAHSGDHAIYPDCRREFADAMNQAIQLCDWHPLSLERPFVDLSKADIVKLGAELDVPFAQTWSCYKGQAIHCGTCGTCLERREAFYLAGIEDPTEYDAKGPALETLIANNWSLKQ